MTRPPARLRRHPAGALVDMELRIGGGGLEVTT